MMDDAPDYDLPWDPPLRAPMWRRVGNEIVNTLTGRVEGRILFPGKEGR